MNRLLTFFIILFILCATTFSLKAQQDSAKQDSTKKATKELPLEPERNISFSIDKGTCKP